MPKRTSVRGNAEPSSAKGRGARRTQPSPYDQFKEYGGKRYTGMKVGGHHTWRYDAGEWKEKKITPDKWEFRYAVAKRRAGKAPEGSGAPVGTAYHWYILADQVITKLDANSYMTEMVGVKYKLAHRRADKDAWSASERAQRKHLVQVLEELIAELERAPTQTAAPPERKREPAKTAQRPAASSRPRRPRARRAAA